MRIFISWSGGTSKKVANQLCKWIPRVFPNIEKPWVSHKDIDAGERWDTALEDILRDMTFGIVCLTEENLQSPWLHFEAGAITKSVGSAVCPFLLGCHFGEIPSPLGQFQGKVADKEGTWDLIWAINNRSGEKRLRETGLKSQFDNFWPELQSELSVIKNDYEANKKSLSQRLSENTLNAEIANDVKIIKMPIFVERETGLCDGDNVSLFSNTLHYDISFFVPVVTENLNRNVIYRYLMADDDNTHGNWLVFLDELKKAGAKRFPEGRFTAVAPLIWTTAIYQFKKPDREIQAISILEHRYDSNVCVEVSTRIAQEMCARFKLFWNKAIER